MQGGDQYPQYPHQPHLQQTGLPLQNTGMYQGAGNIYAPPPAQQQPRFDPAPQPPVQQNNGTNQEGDEDVHDNEDDDQNSDLLFEQQQQPQQQQQPGGGQEVKQTTVEQQHVVKTTVEQQQYMHELTAEQKLAQQQQAQYIATQQKNMGQQSPSFYPPPHATVQPPTTSYAKEGQKEYYEQEVVQERRQNVHEDKKLPSREQIRQPEKSKNYNQILNPTAPSNTNYEENLKNITDKIKAGEIDQSIALMEQIGISPRDFKYQAFQHNCIFFASVIKNDDICKKAIQRFIEHGVDITYVDILKQSILFYLAREGHTKCIQLAVQNGCSGVNNADTYKQTPLYYAAREGNVEAAQRLIQLGANVEVEDHAQQSPLFYAAKSGKVEMVKLLIAWGANVNKKDKRKCTPLMQARRNNQNEVAQVLLENGATSTPDPNDKKKAQSKKKSNQKKKVNIDKVSTKKYILHRQKENGEWEPVPQEEWESFKAQCPEVANYLENPQLLNKLEIPGIPDTMQLFDCWEKAGKKIMQVLWKHQGARLFHQPVDPQAMQIPDYPDIVKNPMDFGTIKRKLNAYGYTNGQEFMSDMKLVFDNCILYNGANSEVGMIARSIEEEFNN